MANDVVIDTELLKDALKISGLKTKTETVNQALMEYVEKHKQQDIISLFGNLPADDDYDYKRGR